MLIESAGPLTVLRTCFVQNNIALAPIALYSSILQAKDNFQQLSRGGTCPLAASYSPGRSSSSMVPTCSFFDSSVCLSVDPYSPTAPPTMAPTSSAPTNSPSSTPTANPTIAPTTHPTISPTQPPSTKEPTVLPSSSPTQFPSGQPSSLPSDFPSAAETSAKELAFESDCKALWSTFPCLLCLLVMLLPFSY